MKVKTSSSKVNSRTQDDDRVLYLASLIKNISNALIFTDMEFNILEWNTAAENLYGWTEAEVIGRPLRDFIQSKYEHAAREDVVNIVLEKGNWKGEGTQNRKDGTRFPMTASVSLVKDEAGDPIGFVTIICDSTDRKHVDEEIVSMAKFPSENPNPVLRLSRDGIVMYANAASAALLRLWRCTTGGTVPGFWHDLTTETLTSMENKTVETECEGKVYSIFVTPIADMGYVNLYARDITELKQMEETLKESEAKFRNVFEGSPLGKSLTDMDGMLMVNQAFCDIVGYSEEELKAKSWKEITHPDDIQKSLDVAQSLVDGKVSNVHFEKRYIHKNGRPVWTDVIIALYRNENEKPLYFMTTLSDITERKRSESLIHDLRVFNETVLNNFPIGILTYKITGECVSANEKAASIVGTDIENLKAQNFREIEAWKGSGLYDFVMRAIATRTLATSDLHHMSTFGKDVWLAASCVIFESKNEDHILLAISDITERKRTEEHLAYQAHLLSNVNDAIVSSNAQFQVTAWNAAAESMYGWKSEEVLGRNGVEILQTRWEQKDPDQMRRTIAETGHWRGEATQLRKDGTRIQVEISSVVLYDENGRATSYVSVNREITQRRQIEEVLARQAEDLRRSNDELQQFAYVASHDLQEPLRMVASYTKLLEKRYKGRLDEDADEFINYVVDGATRMQQLINSLLDYSRVGTHGKELVATSCETVLDEALANLALAIEDSGAVITRDSLPTLMTDAPQLTQLFQNLIANAIRFRGEQPPVIHISAERSQADWLFSVRDNGIGMESQYFNRIFVIFQRLHTRAAYPGTGIGLAICKKIVERLGGRIWVESEPGKGATFRFTIPLRIHKGAQGHENNSAA